MTGCSMCCGDFDYHYPTRGGVYQRTNPEYGRVGSIYSDPMADPGVPALTNNDVPDDRQRREPIDLEGGDDDLEDGTTDGDGTMETGPYDRQDNDTTLSFPGQWR